MLRFAVYVLLALILLQTTFSQLEESFMDCEGQMGNLSGKGLEEDFRKPVYEALKKKKSELKQNCTLEGIALVTITFGDENEWRPLYYNSTDDVQHLRYSEKNTVGRIYGKKKPWGNLNISSFVDRAMSLWNGNLTSDSINAKTQVGCNFDVDFNFTLVCAFA